MRLRYRQTEASIIYDINCCTEINHGDSQWPFQEPMYRRDLRHIKPEGNVYIRIPRGYGLTWGTVLVVRILKSAQNMAMGMELLICGYIIGISWKHRANIIQARYTTQQCKTSGNGWQPHKNPLGKGSLVRFFPLLNGIAERIKWRVLWKNGRHEQ